jgi:hypothetical protein
MRTDIMMAIAAFAIAIQYNARAISIYQYSFLFTILINNNFLYMVTMICWFQTAPAMNKQWNTGNDKSNAEQ